MKNLLLIIIIAFTYYGCLRNKRDVNFEYFKVLSLYAADSINIYNKGSGLSMYAYHNPETDSFIYRNLSGLDPYRYDTYDGKLNNYKLLDTIQNVIQILKQHDNGIMYDTVDDGSVYCGPVVYVEFKDNQGVHFNEFVIGNNDTLNDFAESIYKLEKSFKEKKLVANNTVDVDKEAVSAMKALKLYEKRETPYIPFYCEPGIDIKKIYGSWRQVSENDLNHKYSYNKTTFTKDGDYLLDKVKDGHAEFKFKAKFRLNSTTNDFILNNGIADRKCSIVKLSDSCLEYIEHDGGNKDFVMKLNRL